MDTLLPSKLFAEDLNDGANALTLSLPFLSNLIML
jgi:hypothetical protein